MSQLVKVLSHISQFLITSIKYLVQSIQSQSENCKLVCIGTHKDRQSECMETLSDKNETFLKFAEKVESLSNRQKNGVIAHGI